MPMTPDELAEHFIRKAADLDLRASEVRDYFADSIRKRDAVAAGVERVLTGALEVHAFAGADDGNGYNREECGTCWRTCAWCDERVSEGRLDCKGHDARRALAAVESLKQGGL